MPEPGPRPIPQPPEKLLLGNVLDLGRETQVQDLMRLAREYGEIFYLQLAGRRLVVVSSHRLVDELSDESRFDKRIWAPLRNLRAFAGDGLFTAHTFEPNWPKAHHILLPSFSQQAMKGYHPMMLDIARQLLDRWARQNPGDEVDVPDTMTRLTLDTIGLCGFDFRFNSFYRERMHPFIRAMTRAMSIALGRSVRPDISNRLLFRENQRFRRSIELMNETVDGIIRERRRGGDHAAKQDLLAAMLLGRDPHTGEGLDDLNIRYQILTFLIAGHETTSGLLSFALYFLVQHPAVLEQARSEVDRVLGGDLDRDPSFRDVTELRAVRQVLNESLRLWPTAPMFALFPKEGTTTLGGAYEVDKRDAIAVLAPMLHRDPAVWGRNPEVFDLAHFSPEAEAALPPNAFKPFGNGQRACIGRQFAMHEATLALGMILQRFELHDHRNYQLRVKETLTLKPEDFFLRVVPRAPRVPAPVARPASPGTDAITPPPAAVVRGGTLAEPRQSQSHGTPFLVLFGSNMGTAEGLANRIAEDAEARGFAVTISPMDDFVGRLPVAGAVTLVTSSYNGTPPDNAVAFCRWLHDPALAPDALAGVRYAVFGCGHRDWASTYQHVPQLVDRLLAEHGAERIHALGAGDGGGDFDGDFEAWYQGFWPRVAEQLGVDAPASAEVSTTRGRAQLRVEVVEDSQAHPFVEAFGARPMVVVENREIQGPGAGRSTRHIELALPAGVSYETGDHLGVIAHNDEALARRVAARFGFDEHSRVRVTRTAAGKSELPLGQTIGVVRLLRDYVELQDPATRIQLEHLAEHAPCPPDQKLLRSLCLDDEASRSRFRAEVLEKRRSVFDLLEELPSCELPFESFLSMLPPLRPRYYSISSSPRKYERILSITVGVARGPARSGRGEFRGLCSSYLAERPRGSSVWAFVRDTGSAFRPPKSPRTPMILVGPGTGIAPFRGFLQDRLDQQEKGARVGRSLLFFGCRHPDHDFLYRDELHAFASAGVTQLVCAFSRLDLGEAGPERDGISSGSKTPSGSRTYVQHQITAQSATVWELLEEGAVVYVCGASQMAGEVRRAFGDVYRKQTGGDEAAAERWLDELRDARRYLVDVWATG
jgi:cytochrome P450 / NADPH-cytochrome P450 reductase